MRIGIPREVKDDEYRVAITPAGVHELVAAGHEVVVEHDSLFYCAANMPGAVPRTSTYALTNATLPHAVAATHGLEAVALEEALGADDSRP